MGVIDAHRYLYSVLDIGYLILFALAVSIYLSRRASINKKELREAALGCAYQVNYASG
jgi:hypothetical protein